MDFLSQVKNMWKKYPPFSEEFDSSKWLGLFSGNSTFKIASVSKFVAYFSQLFACGSMKLRGKIVDFLGEFVVGNKLEEKEMEGVYSFVYKLVLEEDDHDVILKLIELVCESLRTAIKGNTNHYLKLYVFLLSMMDGEHKEIGELLSRKLKGLSTVCNAFMAWTENGQAFSWKLLKPLFDHFVWRFTHLVNYVEKEIVMYLKGFSVFVKDTFSDTKGNDSVVSWKSFMKEVLVNIPTSKSHQTALKFGVTNVIRCLNFDVYCESFRLEMEDILRIMRSREKKIEENQSSENVHEFIEEVIRKEEKQAPRSSTKFISVWNESRTKILEKYSFGFQIYATMKEKIAISDITITKIIGLFSIPKKELDTQFDKITNLSLWREAVMYMFDVFVFMNGNIKEELRMRLIWFFLPYCSRNNFVQKKGIVLKARKLFFALIDGSKEKSRADLIMYFMTLMKPLFQLKPIEEKSENWKLVSWLIPSLKFLVLSIRFPKCNMGYLDLTVPIVLRIFDDFQNSNKLVAIDILNHLMENCSKTNIRFFKDLLMKRAEHCLHFREVELLERSLPFSLKLLSVLVPQRIEIICNSIEYFRILKKMLGCLFYSKKPAQRIVVLKNLRKMIAIMKFGVMKYLRTIFDHLLGNDYLGICGNEKVFLETLECICMLSYECWPKALSYFERVLSTLRRSSYLSDENCTVLITKYLRITNNISISKVKSILERGVYKDSELATLYGQLKSKNN